MIITYAGNIKEHTLLIVENELLELCIDYRCALLRLKLKAIKFTPVLRQHMKACTLHFSIIIILLLTGTRWEFLHFYRYIKEVRYKW